MIKNLKEITRNDVFSLLNSNDGSSILALGAEKEFRLETHINAFSLLSEFIKKNHGEYIFGYISYDLKNDVEQNLISQNKKYLHFPEVYFYIPKDVFEIKNEKINRLKGKSDIKIEFSKNLYSQREKKIGNFKLSSIVSYETYAENFKKIYNHLMRGDIYEMNYCIPFYGKKNADPFLVYNQLNHLTESPFSVFHRNDQNHLISGSPERFFTKRGNKLISQPIKGTKKRSISNMEEDEHSKKELENDPKERSENIMIVDLVRNDLSRIAKKNSVKVEELTKIYSYKTVHQMVSTISCELQEGLDWKDIFHALFPMGSMTGAPKISAMEIIEQQEIFKRGIYSGSFGYLSPNGNADFNVIIRTLLHDSNTNEWLAPVGSAITVKSEAKKEYEECLLKAEAMIKAINE